jgi:hypothetical protein
MGGSTTTTQSTNQSSRTAPWEPTIPALTDIIGQLGARTGAAAPTAAESGAIDRLAANAQAGNPYAPAIGSLATDLLTGGTDRTALASRGYADYQQALTPFARGDFVNPASNPALQPYLDTIRNDVTNSVNGTFAGAGRDLSGLNQQALARGIAQGEAPVLLDAYQQGLGNQLNAINALYGAGNTSAGLLSNLDQNALANRQAGVGAATAALQARDSSANQSLQAEALRRGLPLQNIQQLQSLLIPLAQLGGSQQSQGTSVASQQMPFANQLIGGILGGAGLLGGLGAFGGNGWLMGGANSLLGGLGARGGAN